MRTIVNLGSALTSSAAAVTSAAASVCCIGPLALTLLGVNGAILAAALKPYRFPLLGASGLLLGLALWAVYGRRRKGERGRSCRVGAGRLTRRVVWIAAIVWALSAVNNLVVYPYWLRGGVL